MKEFPVRLHVLLARNASTGVVIRRGPAKTTAIFEWNRKKDTFRLGQWVRARIYERRCDLSPDGKWFLYFALNGRWESETRGAWTAISIVPYLKAVTLFAWGDTWFGGGLFTGKASYWLNPGFPAESPLREDPRLQRDLGFQPTQLCPRELIDFSKTVFNVRMIREGWRVVSHSTHLRVFEKPAPHGWILRKFAHDEANAAPGKGSDWEEHELERPDSGLRIPGKSSEWCDLDGKRLVWAEKGKLWAAHLGKQGLIDAKRLHDFNGMKFEAISAPY